MPPELHHLDPPAGPASDSSPPGDADAGAFVESIPIEGETGPGPGPAPGPSVLTREQFAAGLAAAFQLSGGLVGLRTLAGAPELPTFGPAAAALYDTAAETPGLRWLIDPQSVWLGRAIAVGAFAVPVAAGVAGELRERREAAAAAAAPPVDGAELPPEA